MYKYLLCWRYLRTRYIALASVVSVMLGVATMIVVNSVMAGFSNKMQDRLHGVVADIVVESAYDLDGFYNSDEVMARIRDVAGDKIVAMNAAMETFGLLKFTLRRPVVHAPGPDLRHRREASAPAPAASPSTSSTRRGEADRAIVRGAASPPQGRCPRPARSCRTSPPTIPCTT